MRIFENLNINFLGKRKIFYAVSAILFLAGISSIIFKGLEFGIDFKGGSEIALQFEKPVNIISLREYSKEFGLGNVEIRTFGDERGALIRTETQELSREIYAKVVSNIEENIEQLFPGLFKKVVDSTINSITYEFENVDTTNQLIDQLFAVGFQTGKATDEYENKQMIVRVGVSDWIKHVLKDKISDNKFTVQKEDKVGPKIGKELKRDAVLAVLLSLVVILIYLGFRFKFIFALGAVAALFHDVLITLGIYSLMYGAFPSLNLEISLTVVAAFLTLVGYSINDTVIVFDRAREFLKLHRTEDLEKNINSAINRTMSRTILTGGTTLLTVLILFIFGGEVLRSFAFTLLFGIIIGTYSSIFVASALVLDYAKRSKKRIEF